MRACAVVALLLPALAAANPYLDKGRSLYDQLRYADAIAQLRVARDVPNTTRAEKLEAMDLLARCLIAEGQRDDAARVYADLLTAAPGVELDEALSPKIREVFDEVKHRLYPDGYTALKPQPSAPGIARLELLDPWHRVARVVVHVQRGADGSDADAQLEDGAYVAPLGPVGTEPLAWFAEALSAQGETVATLGSRSAPLVVVRREVARVDTNAPPPTSAKPAGIRIGAGVAAAVAVAAATAGGIMQYRSSSAAQRAASPDAWVDEGAAWHARAQSDATWAAGLFVGSGAAAVTAVVLFAW